MTRKSESLRYNSGIFFTYLPSEIDDAGNTGLTVNKENQPLDEEFEICWRVYTVMFTSIPSQNTGLFENLVWDLA